MGGNGNDIVIGDGDIYLPGGGRDTLHGDAGNDTLSGDGALSYYSSGVNDLLDGGDGNEQLFGFHGNDRESSR